MVRRVEFFIRTPKNFDITGEYVFGDLISVRLLSLDKTTKSLITRRPKLVFVDYVYSYYISI